jgi:dipeptidyl-peptidase-4
MDTSRVGIYGWSFGGYLSALALLARPDVFKVAVAGAPVVDWRDYDTAYTERYLGLPEPNAAAYDEASLLTHAAKPSQARPLLVIHGTADDNVYFTHSLKLANAMERAGRPFELMPLVGITHLPYEPEMAEKLWTRVAEFLRAHLDA